MANGGNWHGVPMAAKLLFSKALNSFPIMFLYVWCAIAPVFVWYTTKGAELLTIWL